jgi:hypothetical protein
MSMKKFFGCLLLLCLLFSAVGILLAQDQPTPPPKVLLIYREFLKPGKMGSAHEKTEAAFVNASINAKWPQHYLAMDSMTGAPRSLFFFGYPSFEALERDQQATQKDASYSSQLDRASGADGELLSSQDSSAFLFNDELSLNAPIPIAKMRNMEIGVYVVRPGHNKDWEDLVKLYRDAYQKVMPESHWAAYDAVYGNNISGLHLIIVPMRSLSEADVNFANSKKIEAALGEDGAKKAAELEAACMQQSQTNIFAFNPRMSYVSDSWVQADPGFWKTKTKMAAKKVEHKAAAGQ